MPADFPALVILAAGRSERMGYPKGLKLLDGKPLLTAHLEAFHALGGSEIAVVSSVHFCVYDDLLQTSGVRHLRNPHPEHGPFSSLQMALAHLPGRHVLLSPVDTNPTTQEILLILSQGLCLDKLAVVPTCQERGGHPVLLHRDLCRDLLMMDPAQSRLDHVLHSLAERVARLNIPDQRILQNYNTP